MCAEDVYTDCPSRERGLYGGDFLVEMAVALAGSPDLRLTRRCIDLFADHPNEAGAGIPGRVPGRRAEQADQDPGLADYGLLVLLAWEWCVRRSGDWEFARKHYGTFSRLADAYLDHASVNGLVSWGRPFIRHRRFDRGEFNTCINALLSACLRALARQAGRLGRNDDCNRYAGRAAQLERTTRQAFWDEENRRFADGIRGGRPVEGAEVVSNAAPIIFGVADARQARDVGRYMKQQLSQVDAARGDRLYSPYSGFFILAALYRLGMEELAETIIRRDWGRMLQGDATTTWEHFTSDKSLCHAWGAGPTFYLSTRVLGVRQGWPDPVPHDEVLIAPCSAQLSWARGRVPHRLGPVRVDWQVQGERLLLNYDAPPGVPVRAEPRGRLAHYKLLVNGRPAE
jgi:hypothetical protein